MLFLITVSLIHLNLLKDREISIIAPLSNLSPLFLLVLSSVFLQEVISVIQMLGIFIVIIGTYILELYRNHHHYTVPHKRHFKELLSMDIKFYILVVIMLISMSLVVITDRIILTSGVNVVSNLYFTSLCGFVVISIYLIYKKEFFKAFTNTVRQPQTLLISLMGIIDNFLIVTAVFLPNALVSLIIPIRRTSTVFSAIFGGILFHEKHLLQKGI